MKGIAPIVAVVLVASSAVLIFGGAFANLAFNIYVSLSEVLKEKILIDAINQIALARLSLKHALRYSYYQACYELAKIGFGRDYWYLFGKNAPDTKEVRNMIEGRTAKILNEYIEVLGKEFEIKIPFVAGDEIVLGKVFIEIKTEKKLTKEFGFGSINDTLNISIFAPDPIFDMYFFALRNFVEREIVKEAVDYGKNNLPSNCLFQSQLFCPCQDEILPIDESFCFSELQKNIQQFMHNYIANLPLKKFSVEFELKEIDYSYIPSCYSDECKERVECGCKEEEEGECVKYYEGNYVNCNYEWKVVADFKIRIKTKELQYPVYDEGKTEWRKLSLNFNIKGGDA